MKEHDPTVSETSRVRDLVLPYLQPKACGLDIGFGGANLSPQLMAVDSWAKYTNFDGDPQHLFGDGKSLHWFRDEVISFIWSSHYLEDEIDTLGILREWFRVLAPGGLLGLYLPWETRYRAHCDLTGQSYNASHQCLEMSLPYMLPIVQSLGLEIVLTLDEGDTGYSFLILAAKPMVLDSADALRLVEEFQRTVKPFVVTVPERHRDAPAMIRWLEGYKYEHRVGNTFYLKAPKTLTK